MSRFGLMIGLMTAACLACDRADAQYYRFGPGGGVSIQSPFFSLNVPSSSRYYGYRGPHHHGPRGPGIGLYGSSVYGFGTYGPSLVVPPLPPVPSYRSYHYRYPSSSYRYGSSYRPYGYYYSPGISSFHLEIGPDYVGPDIRTSPYDRPDPYAYRGNVITPQQPGEVYSMGRVPVDDVDPVRLADDLRIAAERLRQSLASRPDDADVWLDYLNPDAIIDALNDSDVARSDVDLSALAGNYDGVAGNPQLGSVSTAAGFSRVRSLLRLWLDRQNGFDAGAATSAMPQDGNEQAADASSGGEPATESILEPVDPSESEIPTPLPEPDPNADSTQADVPNDVPDNSPNNVPNGAGEPVEKATRRSL
tara:strand:- start:650335 stop:651423 length:1089 start_codon:yes stop_codon:yes gene_type:complete